MKLKATQEGLLTICSDMRRSIATKEGDLCIYIVCVYQYSLHSMTTPLYLNSHLHFKGTICCILKTLDSKGACTLFTFILVYFNKTSSSE